MTKHFEDLWEQAEQANKFETSSVKEVLLELSMKIKLYELIADTSEKQAKSKIMGEILFALTKLSLKEDINTYIALKNILESK